MNASVEYDLVLQRAKNECYAGNTRAISDKFCERLFDGYYCWDWTPPGVFAHQQCSTDFFTTSENGLVARHCDEYGQWVNWTNTTQCGSSYYFNSISEFSEDEITYKNWISIIKKVSQSGYILSMISLIIALLIFINIKLHCPRNKLHMHLFTSFILKASISLIRDGVLVEGTAFSHEVNYHNGQPIFEKINYSWMCKALTSFWHYSIISNYTFLLMEGAYLHNLLFIKSFSENRVSMYCIIGWGFPLLFMIPWVALRALHENDYCWTLRKNNYINVLTEIPIGFTIITNFVFFSIVVKILFVKLNSMYVQQTWMKYQRLVRAILILVPLFGIPYVVSLVLYFYVKLDQTYEIPWIFFDQIFVSYQGLFASLVYCLFNNEVQVELVRKYRSFKDRHNREFKRRSRTISHTTQMALAEELQDFARDLGIRENMNNKSNEYF